MGGAFFQQPTKSFPPRRRTDAGAQRIETIRGGHWPAVSRGKGRLAESIYFAWGGSFQETQDRPHFPLAGGRWPDAGQAGDLSRFFFFV